MDGTTGAGVGGDVVVVSPFPPALALPVEGSEGGGRGGGGGCIEEEDPPDPPLDTDGREEVEEEVEAEVEGGVRLIVP